VKGIERILAQKVLLSQLFPHTLVTYSMTNQIIINALITENQAL